MRAPLRIGLAGCGRIAERGYAPAAAALEQLRIVAVADPDAARAGRLAASLGAPSFDSTEAMLAAGGLEALVVAAPVDRHLEIASLAAGAALPCLVEKPPAADLDGARALAALDPAPAIGFNRRFLQGAELAGSVPPEGWLELDLALRFRRSAWSAHSCRDEALLDAGIHLIDLACFLTDATPIAVRRAVVEPERAALELELSRGRARIACATDAGYAERVTVRDRGRRTVAASRIGRAGALLRRLRGGEDPLLASLRAQLSAFAAFARGEEAGVLAAAEAAPRALGVVEAARRSAALGGAEVLIGRASEVPA